MPDNRQSVRHDVNLTATVVVSGETHASNVLNLSLGGALLSYADRLPMGERVDVEFSIPTQKEPIAVGSRHVCKCMQLCTNVNAFTQHQ